MRTSHVPPLSAARLRHAESRKDLSPLPADCACPEGLSAVRSHLIIDGGFEWIIRQIRFSTAGLKNKKQKNLSWRSFERRILPRNKFVFKASIKQRFRGFHPGKRSNSRRIPVKSSDDRVLYSTEGSARLCKSRCRQRYPHGTDNHRLPNRMTTDWPYRWWRRTKIPFRCGGRAVVSFQEFGQVCPPEWQWKYRWYYV